MRGRRNPEAQIERIRNRLARRIRRLRKEARARIAEIKAELDVRGISAALPRFVAAFEGIKLVAYRLPGEIHWTIGIGHYGPDVKPGMKITKEQAYDLFHEDMAWVVKAIRDNVEVGLDRWEFDALASFIFNIGAGAFADSTLLRLLNEGKRKAAADQFGRWVNGATGPLEGLVTRRRCEKRLFLHHVYETS